VIYRFDDYVLDTDRRELRCTGALCSLEPQVFDLLEFLIRNNERVVSKKDVLNAVWGGRIVSEAALHTRVSAARHAIGDNGAEQRLIRTIRIKGFRFIGSVREETKSIGMAALQKKGASGPSLADQPTIAVVPFANISGTPGQESIADGLTEDLITTLSKIGWLFVATRASSFAFKNQALGSAEIARKLGVRYLLGGSIRQMAGRQRITVQLVDGISDCQIWTERYDRDIIDNFTTQDEICDSVAAMVECQLFLAEHLRVEQKSPISVSTWECVVRALALMNRRKERDVLAAHGLLQKAVTVDPGSAQNFSLLSMVTTLRVHMGWANRQRLIASALACARKALSLNPDEPWAHAALGYALIWKQPEQAIVPCQRAVALNPNFAIGHYFLALACAYAGQHDQVFPHAGSAERLAKRDLLARGYGGAHNNVRSTGSFAAEHYHKGIEFGHNAVVDNPNAPTAYRALMINLALGGQLDEAKRALQTLRRLAPEISQDWIRQNSVWTSDSTMKRYIEAFRMVGLE
jgi:TolB-like protein